MDYMDFVNELRRMLIKMLKYDEKHIIFQEKGKVLAEEDDRLLILVEKDDEIEEYHALDTRGLFDKVYNNEITIPELVHDVIQMMSVYRSISCTERLLLLKDYDKVKKYLMIRLKNCEYHKQDIENAVYQEIEGIALVVYLNLGEQAGNLISVAVDKCYLDHWGLTREELIKQIMNNTMLQAPPRIYLWEKWRLDQNYAGEELPERAEEFRKNPVGGSYCISTSKKMNGAVAIFMEDVAEKMSEIFEDDLIIVFTSMHEVMVHAYSTNDPEEIKKILKMTMEKSTPAEDVLTEHIYYYDRNTREIMRYMGEKFVWQKIMNRK